jgi:ParB-like nuclease family protein
VADFEASQTDVPSADHHDDDAEERPGRTSVAIQREGLPAGYRMRAERHYVDSIASHAAGSPVRLIPVDQFTSAAARVSSELEPLVKSIATHGVVHPLLVRKHHSEYRVIAGRKRLAAAVAAGLTEVPCLVQQVGDAEALALAAADNLRVAGPDPAPRPETLPSADLLRDVAADLVRISRSARFLREMPGGFQRNAAVDFLAADAWRTSWLTGALAFVAAPRRAPEKRRSLESIVDRVVDGFEPERRLSGLVLRTSIAAGVPALVDGRAIELALVAAVLVSLSAFDDVEGLVIELAVQPVQERGFSVTVAQRLSADTDRFGRDDSGRPDLRAPRGLVAFATTVLSTIAAQYGGAAEVDLDAASGPIVRCTFRQT